MYWNKEKDEEEEEVEVCKVVGNEMYFVGDISPENNLEFLEKFKRLESTLLKMAADLHGYRPEIRIHICSDGGDLFSGFSLMNHIEKSRVRVVTIADGSCCSAATFFLLGGQERRISRNAFILIHQLSTGHYGKYEEMKDELRTCDKLMEQIRDVYTAKTNIPEKKLNKLLKHDIYLEAAKALKYQVVHAYD
jgi:ATP-dependent protease ClpP protease subunit